MTRQLLALVFIVAFLGLVVVSFVLGVNGAVLVLAVVMAGSGGLLIATRAGAR
ncbi:hypothetical protein [Herbiconiux sp.]|uniref:hypothetical protein n=1 Tax=Herbiconiux sp. TaxID=1871186 RepID=UPI0025C63992|nr:hypothetical protein [Herbiconiux sp.]